jgi:hypothetical protein
MPDLEWRWRAWAARQSERNVDVARRDQLTAITQRSPEAAARFEAIRAQEDVLERAVEELLRWTAPGTVVPLTASKDMQVTLESAMVVKGCPHAPGDSLTIRRGETIAVAVDELNRRCPVGGGRFDTGEPASLDVSRGDNTSHLSFGLRHACIGAFLAKENAKRAIEGILRRFPDLELAGDPIPQRWSLQRAGESSGSAALPILRPVRESVAAIGGLCIGACSGEGTRACKRRPTACLGRLSVLRLPRCMSATSRQRGLAAPSDAAVPTFQWRSRIRAWQSWIRSRGSFARWTRAEPPSSRPQSRTSGPGRDGADGRP